MPDYDLSQLLDRAAASYSPDTSKALAKVKARSNRQRHSRMLSIPILLVGVVAVSLALVLTLSRQQTANPVRYLRISPAVRILDLPAASTKGPSGLSDVYFADSQHGIGLDQHCVLSPTTNTVCSLAIVRTNDAGRTWKPVGETLHVTYPDSRASICSSTLLRTARTGGSMDRKRSSLTTVENRLRRAVPEGWSWISRLWGRRRGH